MGDWLARLWPIGLFIGLVLVLRRVFSQPKPKTTDPPYKKRGSVLGDASRQFYHALRAAVGMQWAVLTMIRLPDVISVPDDLPDHGDWQGKIDGQRLEFLICDAHTLEPRAVIELDDRPPEQASSGPKNAILAEALSTAGLPLFHIPLSPHYNSAELRGMLEQALKPVK